ncbi:hypothetical protein [Halorussus halophilus]|uniref:hypothetical protein n=1 Tax=Halorussus halophilus TaxID=2650975 RepID=UPI0013016ADC|nr:hypothetical protein [Halorussus halophilus]
MVTFVEEVQAVEDGNVEQFDQRLAERIEAVTEAVEYLEEWTESTEETRAELTSKYEMAKTFARNEIRAADDDADAESVPATELLDHPAVSEQTRENLSEYSTKLAVFFDEEQSYREARQAILDAVTAELDLYNDVLLELDSGESSVTDAKQRIARFARDGSIGPANKTAVDIVLDSDADEER